MMETLSDLTEFISREFDFSEEKYPALKNASAEQKRAFAIKHLALHLSKTAGNISAVSESVDHGNSIDEEKLKEQIPKIFITTLKLADIAQMSEKEIIEAVKKVVK